MADDANQALPRLTFFFPQRLTEVGEHEQLVRTAALTKAAAPDFPTADAARKCGVDDARRLAGQAFVEVELGRAASQQALGRLAQQASAGAVHELELVVFIEGENRDIDLRHHLSQERRRLERVEALVAERFDERVDLDHDLAERVAAARAAGPNREVTLAERGKQVGERLERQDDALAERQRKTQAERDDEDAQRPLDLGREVACPQEDEGDECPRQRRGERHQQDAAVVAQARLAGRRHDRDRVVQGSWFRVEARTLNVQP